MLFRKDIEPRCAYCAQGVRINETQVACMKKGIVAAENHCFRFRQSCKANNERFDF